MRHRAHVRSEPRDRRATRGLSAAALAALDQQGAPPCQLTIVLTSDEAIRDLNRRFLGEDATTDVLAFPDGSHDEESGRLHLGDVVIAVPCARRQAETSGNTLIDELRLLVVHATLHLLGHDHDETARRDRMWGAQHAILERLGWKAKMPQ